MQLSELDVRSIGVTFDLQHHVKIGFDLATMSYTDLRCNDRVFDVSAMQPMSMPAMKSGRTPPRPSRTKPVPAGASVRVIASVALKE